VNHLGGADALGDRMTPERTDPMLLARLRTEIEGIDRALLLLLVARMNAAGRAIDARIARGEPVTDTLQEQKVMDRSRGWGEQLGLPRPLVEGLFRDLLDTGKARYLAGGSKAEPPRVTVRIDPPGLLENEIRTRLRVELASVAAAR
jgi:chorismate mutase